MTRITPLYAWLHRIAAMPHEWGYCDCMMVLADWVLTVRGFDPGEGLRGTYGNPEICPIGRRYQADPEPLWREALVALPLVETTSPGDVALVTLRGQRFMVGAVALERGNWAMKTAGKGLVITRAARPHLIWGVGYAA